MNKSIATTNAVATGVAVAAALSSTTLLHATSNNVNNASSSSTTVLPRAKSKENGGGADSKAGRSRSRNRDPLSNITNNNTRKSSQTGKLLKVEKSAKASSKRSAAVLQDTSNTNNSNSNSNNANHVSVSTNDVGNVLKVVVVDSVGSVAAVSANASVSQDMKKTKSDPMMIDEEVQKWEDIDANDGDDPQAVSDYVNEIYENMMEKEKKDRIDPRFLSNQTDINEKMRSILVDWLVEVHRMFKLLPETLFLAINLIDRYLETKPVPREKLQLVGITSMLVASKYEEIYAPECNDFVYISDGAYAKDQILTMEQTILNALNFNLTHPSPLHFLRRYSKAAGSDYTLHTLCKYLIELMLIDVKLLKYTSSQIAAGSVYIARLMTQRTPTWTATLEHYSTYSEVQVHGVAVDMNEVLKKAQKSSLKAIKKKYSTQKFGQVAEIPIIVDL